MTPWELAVAERGSPTIVRDGGKDIPATGVFWIDPVSGGVPRTTMRLEMNRVMAEMAVTYRLANGNLRRVELQRYEAHGIGRRDLKIKNDVDDQCDV